MESLFFVLQRFFISFLSGCILNLYIIIYYFVLKHANITLPFSDVVILSMSSIFKANPYIIFIIITALISVFIEGICQIGMQYYLDLSRDNKIFKSNGKYTFRGHFVCRIFIDPTILWASKYYVKNENPINTFIADSGYPFWDVYDAVHKCARIIERENKKINIYRFRDHSFIIQLIRLSFFCIALIGLVSAISFQIIGNNDKPLRCFIYLSIFISLFLIPAMTVMSNRFAQRYIRDVGLAYEAFKLNSPIRNSTLQNHLQVLKSICSKNKV